MALSIIIMQVGHKNSNGGSGTMILERTERGCASQKDCTAIGQRSASWAAPWLMAVLTSAPASSQPISPTSIRDFCHFDHESGRLL
jgi:hypothetical protein